MNIVKTDILLNRDYGTKISAVLYDPGYIKSGELPLIIFCHGFNGFKDWGGFPYMMEKLAAPGFIAVSFNFSFNGVTKENPTEFTRLELFAQNTFSRELDDLKTVIDYFYSHSENFNINKNKIALIGHSRGGGIAIIKASEDKRIKTLITLASISKFDRYTEEQKRKWKEKGFIEIENSRTKQMMRMNYSLIEDTIINKERLDIQKAISKINIPLLIIHGKEDLAVKYTSAQDLFENSNKSNTEINIIDNTGHTFGVVHPFRGTTKAFEKVIEKTVNFLSEKLW